jgi:phage-related protein
MSKAVKKVGRAVSGVVKGVTKAAGGAVKGVSNVVKKIAANPIGRLVLTAGAVYFGGAAIMGAMGGASAGTGFMGTLSGGLKGAAAGIGNAWTGLTSAGSAAMGGNFAQAGSALKGGMTGAHSAGFNAVAPAGSTGLLGGANAAGNAGIVSSGTGAPVAQTGAQYNQAFNMATQAAPAEAGGSLAKAVTRSAMINAGTQLAGNAMSGMAEEGKYKAMLKEEERDRARHSDNVGARLFADGEYQGQFASPQGHGGGLLQSAHNPYYQRDPNSRTGYRSTFA